ncbi:MAG: bifunctional diaminohydroxyphosphoribosylaminopyrimidine deaminase/5-amino-6-(5-phosphoribosylamino)uracil reductase RibD [Deltaproteobacteria bacterium]|nr:bifunctional diaminohydroxyphosphoribosylaminopyrimidine deaminase/5-amino-6-(5-phosphoribosylamino)uracil reductase RibD [Deltaproteobacteria bacterium]
MKAALRLARRGMGWVSPNPMVGAVIVRGEKVIARGYHRRFGGPHAEAEALSSVEGKLKGATLYVTLEPCCHYGKTPPCVDLIIEKGIGRVVIGTEDPNPLVAGKGIRKLLDHGVRVTVGVLEGPCRALNEPHFKYFETGLPLVSLKIAQSLDGRIATKNGSSQWISSPDSRRLAHRWRATHDAVMVGIGTVLSDDPSLTVRLVRGRNPRRIIVDSRLRIPVTSRVLSDGNPSLTTVLTTPRADAKSIEDLRRLGARVIPVSPNPQGRVDLRTALRILSQEGITSVLVEGGAALATSLFRERLVDRLLIVIGPKIIGEGIDAVGDLGTANLTQALGFTIEKTSRVGPDLVVVARPNTRAAGESRHAAAPFAGSPL